MNDQPKELTVTEGHYNARGMSIREMSFVANEMMQAKMFPDITSAHTAFVKIMAGAEMNIGPFQAMAGIHIIQGKAVVGGGLLAGLVKASPKYDYDVLEQTDKVCKLQFRQGKTVLGVSEFTLEDARKAGTKNLEKFPKNMLFNRAMSNGVKWYCPDVTSGPVYVEGEIMDAVVEAEAGPVTNSPESPADQDFRTGTDEPPAPVREPEMEYVEALDEAFTPNPMTPKQRAMIFAILTEKGVTTANARTTLYRVASAHLGKPVEKTEDISKEDAMTLIDHIKGLDAEAIRLFFDE